jgi:hypothetical protein
MEEYPFLDGWEPRAQLTTVTIRCPVRCTVPGSEYKLLHICSNHFAARRDPSGSSPLGLNQLAFDYI